MSLFVRLLWGFGKYILVSLSVTAFGLLISMSLLTGKFPPSWKQFKQLKKSFDSVLAINKQMNGSGDALNFLQSGLQKMALPPHLAPTAAGKAPEQNGDADPAMADVNEILKHRQRQAALSQALSGQGDLSSLAQGQGSQPSKGQQDPVRVLNERVRKLEDLVHSLHSQVYQMNQQMKSIRK